MRHCRSLLAVPVLFAMVSTAAAIGPFYDEFKKEYLVTHKDQKFAESVDKGGFKCLVCHQGAKSKKNRNAFGKEVAKLLTKKDGKNKEKIDAALKKVLAMHVDPKDKKSETYMDRLNAGKWPGAASGKLDELKKEPKPAKEDAKREEPKKE